MAASRLTNRAKLLSLLPLVGIVQAARRALAQDIPPGRCLWCKDRPEWLHDPCAYDPPERRGPLVTAEDLAPCTVCGWQPTYVAIRTVDALTGESWTTAEMFDKVDHDRALRAEIGFEAMVERDRQRIAAWRDTHASSTSEPSWPRSDG